MKDRWVHGSPTTRTVMATVAVALCIALVALFILGARALTLHAEIAQAKARQVELTEDYDFDPGNIISDGQFFDDDSMDEQGIQDFLDEKGASCTGKECLHTKTFTVATRAADDLCDGYVPAKDAKGKVRTKEKAAAIIAGAATSCGISPKVLLTMLQKEQQLVTATDPTAFQYKAAMGLSCPDDDSCDPRYAGFVEQVFGAAERYRYYEAHEEQYGYAAGRLNYVQFNPDPSCGGDEVWIENRATALLYIYTPYQPNLAALAAGSGEGDGCSTYGNRNFALIYTGWFGDPRTA